MFQKKRVMRCNKLPDPSSEVWIHKQLLSYYCSYNSPGPKWSEMREITYLITSKTVKWQVTLKFKWLTSRIFFNFCDDFMDTDAAMIAWSCCRKNSNSKTQIYKCISDFQNHFRYSKQCHIIQFHHFLFLYFSIHFTGVSICRLSL